MNEMGGFSKEERLIEVFRRLDGLPPAANAKEIRSQLEATLNTVEDEMTEIPFDPDAWPTDGRMYPFRDDSMRDVPGRSDVKRYRSLAHNTFIANNGAIEVVRVFDEKVIFVKVGANGKGVGKR